MLQKSQNYRVVLEMPSALTNFLEMYQKREMSEEEFRCESQRFYHQLTALLAEMEGGRYRRRVHIIYWRGWYG